jgi:ATP/maltotriose-dependent transcriptional regulator MalT
VDPVEALEQGRAALARYAWREAYERLSAADRATPLPPADLDRLGEAAYLIGRDGDAAQVWERAHHGFAAAGETARAVRCGFWLGLILLQRGEHARGGGWIARARRLLDDSPLDCVEQGYLHLPMALQALNGGDPAAAQALFVEIVDVADRFGDPDLQALGRLGRGQALVVAGDATRGLSMLDEAMVAVTTGEVSPIPAGIIYCAVIIACRQVFDLRRAQEWTAALSRWCAEQPDLQPYRGQCLVHRSEIMQLHGRWNDALAEVGLACGHVSATSGNPAAGMAYYQRAELLRLRGEFDLAEESYRQAGDRGHTVQPGMALLRLAQGRVTDAEAAIRLAADEADDRVARSRVLAGYVEIMLAGGDVDSARAVADELAGTASTFGSAYLEAVAGYARGSTLLAADDPAGARTVLRRAWRQWCDLDAPYEAARTRRLLGLACSRSGDPDTARMEWDGAREVFVRLGAAPDLAELDALAGAGPDRAVGGLTDREVEVLCLVAAGRTNREIATALVVSEHTVRRHLQNIFGKLGVSSRAAATAYAYRHNLV